MLYKIIDEGRPRSFKCQREDSVISDGMWEERQ